MVSLDPSHMRDSSPTGAAAAGEGESSPLTDDEKLRYDHAVIRDELSQAQRSPTAARRLGARHLGRLIYSLDDAAGVVERHTAPYTTERPTE